MKFEIIREFTSLSQEAFTTMIESIGCTIGACYYINGNKLNLIIATKDQDDLKWPVSPSIVDLFDKPSLTQRELGWIKLTAKIKKNIWPKVSYTYFPDQELRNLKIVFIVGKPQSMRLRQNEPYALLEAASNRIDWLITKDKQLHSNDSSFFIDSSQNQKDLKTLLDHEIRTPLAAIVGSIQLLAIECEGTSELVSEAEAAIKRLMEAMDRMDQLFANSVPSSPIYTIKNTDLSCWLNDIKKKLTDRITSEFPDRLAELKINYALSRSDSYPVRIDSDSLDIAILEVLRNAYSFASVTKIEIALYRSEDSAVIDIHDNGPGVAIGAEQLIFTRFFQEPSGRTSRRNHSGLGIGLFLARKIVESHNGQLHFVRQAGRTGLFRFILPCTESLLVNDSVSIAPLFEER